MPSYQTDLLTVFLSYPTGREASDSDCDLSREEEAVCEEELMVFFSLN